MHKIFTLLTLFFISLSVQGQQPVQNTPADEPYGKINKADLELQSCDFEKDANAEVLFDVYHSDDNKRHVRVKIFNEHGENQANIRMLNIEAGSIKAETINLEDGKITITPLDRKSIFKQGLDKFNTVITFTMPNVKAGSIIEYEYSEGMPAIWYFQGDIPTRYSELNMLFPGTLVFRLIPHIHQPYVKDVGDPTDKYQVKAMANIPSLPNEPYMSSRPANLQRMEFINMSEIVINSWTKLVNEILESAYFTVEFDKNLPGEKPIIAQAKSLKTVDAKIAFVFDTVRKVMANNSQTNFFTIEGILKPWETRTGNTSEINMILYDLLHKSGVDAQLIMMGSKEKAKINPASANLDLISNMMVYVQVDSSTFYLLDASNKYNLYNVIPKDQLNTFGILLHKGDDSKTVFINNDNPVLQSVNITAEIKPGGKMMGTAQVISDSYNKEYSLSKYNIDGEKKFTDDFKNNDNSLQIKSLKMENMTVDSLPLLQDVNFSMDLAGSDESYIYLNPNLFTSLQKNPFTNTERWSDIDFGYRDNLVINGAFTIPAGYKIDAKPKNITMVMPDTSITFKRSVNEQDGIITVRYVINHKKTLYFRKDYPEFSAFYQKLYEMLNEQIVLKKI